MTIDEMIDEAQMDSFSKYTMDFGGSNLFWVANLAASDYANKHPEMDMALVPFIAGALYARYKEFAKEWKKKSYEAQE